MHRSLNILSISEQYIIVINRFIMRMMWMSFEIDVIFYKNFSYIQLLLHTRIFNIISISMHSHFISSRFPSFVLNKNQYLPAEAPFWCCIEYVNIFIYERYKNKKQRFVCPINQPVRNFYNFRIVMSEGKIFFLYFN